MDFPINLKENSKWVYGTAELQQNVEVILRSHLGTFIQPGTIGARFDVHACDDELVEEGVRQTLEQIKYITVEKVTVSLPNVYISLLYQGDVIEYQYNLKV